MVRPYLLGHGGAGRAVTRALALLRELHPGWELAQVTLLPRQVDWDSLRVDGTTDFLVITNPHALHAVTVQKAQRAGFRYVAVEKPVGVTMEDIARLRETPVRGAVFHGYRCLWGPRRVREMIASGELGKIVAIEGRYWQSSAAQRALEATPRAGGWKNDAALSGPYDTYLDLGTHFADLAFYLAGQRARDARAFLSYANAEAPHRDTHVHLTLDFADGTRALGSISKTVHGSGNHLEMVVIGTKGSARWEFASPDQIEVGKGAAKTTVVRRADDGTEAGLPPFHGMGWLEGYLTVLAGLVREMRGEAAAAYPTLEESLAVVECLLGAAR